MMMSGMCASVQAELDTLFGQLKGMAVRSREVSAQAFSKARKGFSAELFHVGNQKIQGCLACNRCYVTKDECCINHSDPVNQWIQKMKS